MPTIHLKPDNFTGTAYLVRTDTGKELYDIILKKYNLCPPPNTAIHLWRSPRGVRHRIPIHKTDIFDNTPVDCYIELVKFTPTLIPASKMSDASQGSM